MTAFRNPQTGSGQDKFGDLYTDYGDTMTALKAGASNNIFIGNGIGSSPSFSSAWESWSVIGSGGAPAFSSNFTQTANSSDRLRIRKSAILDTAEINGRFERTSSSLASGDVAVIFILPLAYRPARPQFGLARGGSQSGMRIIIDQGTGEVFLVNSSGSNFTASDFADITFSYPLS